MSIIRNSYIVKQKMEGAGVLVNRVFGYHEVRDFDPFLMLDYFEKDTAMESNGFPWHPHKGIETISYFLKGSGMHEDSLGNKGTIEAGELQWMTAGKGILHQEMPGDSPNGVQGFQFWVNMHSSQKLNKPSYEYIKKGTMKSIDQDGAIVRVISGSYLGIEGPIQKKDLGITMLHVTIEKGKKLSLSRHAGKNGYIFVFTGKGIINDENVEKMYTYTLNEGKMDITATTKMEFIFAEGRPLNEPIAWHGPIVMNTKEEIRQTLKNLNEGTFL